MGEHTPQPWEASDTHYRAGLANQLNVYGPAGDVILIANSQIRERRVADARLASAAPDLLEALQGVRSLLDLIANGLWEDCPYPEVMKKRIAACEAAISKATSNTGEV